MKNLTLTLEEEVSILDKYRLVPTELFLIRVLLILQDDGDEDLFLRYIKTLKQAGINLRNILITLQEKEILLSNIAIETTRVQNVNNMTDKIKQEISNFEINE